MILSIGTDLVQISKFSHSIERTPELLQRIFLPSERVDMLSLHSLAGRFALKEAVMKATKRQITEWHMIEIVSAPSGEPILTVHHLQWQNCTYAISMSHDGDYAVAFVVIFNPMV